MKFYIISAFFVLIFSSYNSALGQRLDLFTSESESILNNGIKEKVPYYKAIGFYDFILVKYSTDSLIIKEDVYVYFKLSIPVQEIGIRVISPVPDYVFGTTGDIETEFFVTHYKSDKTSYFDPKIELESGIIDGDGNFSKLEILGGNDNSREVIQQPSGKFNNALLRIVRNEFPPGIYRIKIQDSDDAKPVSGSYLLHLGLVPGIKNMKLVRSLDELVK